jgi:hypothetical protein
VTIVRDSLGVAHVTGKTQPDVAFGAGWVTAADRGLLLQLIRGPARIAALDVPGLDPLALTGKTFVPSADTEEFLANQLDALRSQGAMGRHLLTLIDAYTAGVNAYYKANGVPANPYTPKDEIASAALVAARFGANGGQEAANSMFLDALEKRLGDADARSAFADLRESDDPEAPVTAPGRFPYEQTSSPATGSVVLDDGSFAGAPLEAPAFASNVLAVGAQRSATGHPLFVAGRRSGTSSPSSSRRWSSRAAVSRPAAPSFRGFPGSSSDAARTSPGARPRRRPTTSTSSRRRSAATTRTTSIAAGCLAMSRFFVGTLQAQGRPDQPVAYYETVHGPVIGYATVAGKRVAISLQRSTRGREILSAKALTDQLASLMGRSDDANSGGSSYISDWYGYVDKDLRTLLGQPVHGPFSRRHTFSGPPTPEVAPAGGRLPHARLGGECRSAI